MTLIFQTKTQHCSVHQYQQFEMATAFSEYANEETGKVLTTTTLPAGLDDKMPPPGVSLGKAKRSPMSPNGMSNLH